MTEGSPLYAETQELLRRYQAASPLLTVETLNPERNPARAQAFLKETGVMQLSVVFRAGEKKKAVSLEQLAEFDFQRAQMGGEPALKAFKGEQEFTAAILTVTQEKSPKVVFTKGHGERPVAGRSREGLERVVEALKQDNCTVEEWDSLVDQKVPEETDLVVVAGPRTGLHVSRDRRPEGVPRGRGEGAPPPRPGVRPGEREPDGRPRPRSGPRRVRRPARRRHRRRPEERPASHGAGDRRRPELPEPPVTKLLEGLPVVFPVIRSVGAGREGSRRASRRTVLVETSADGWGETNLADLETKVEKDDKDVAGPVPLAVAAETGPGPDREEGPARRRRRRRLRLDGRHRQRREPLPRHVVRELAARPGVPHLDPAEVDRPGRGHPLARRHRPDHALRPPRPPRAPPSGSESWSGSRGAAEGGAMSTRKLLILTGVFLALLAFVVLWERHQPTSEEKAKAKKRLLDLDAKEVASLVVERPDQPTVELSRKDGRWVLEGPKGGAADADDGGRARLRPRAARPPRRDAVEVRPEGVRPRRAEGEGDA